MNKREFKKYADALGASVIDEMTSAYYNVAGIDRDKVAQAIEITLGAVGKARSKSNVTFDRGPKAFENPTEYARTKTRFFRSLFDKIETEFNEEINEALKVFNAAYPADERERNKQYANER